MASITRRVYRTSFLLSLSAILVMVLAVVSANEDLENTMLNLDFAAQRDFIIGQHKPDQQLYWHTANLVAIYVPGSMQKDYPFPPMFQGLEAPYAGEWDENDRSYLINVERTQQGRLYLARDITLFEARESLFFWVMIAVSGVIIGVSFLLAIFSGRRLTLPLKELSDHIRQTPVGQSMPRLNLNFKDTELQVIAQTFNQFLIEMERFVKRESSLVNLASHELRTPITVILGAIEVMEQRNLLSSKDKETLLRIRRSADEMQSNISTLLKLSRREEGAVVSSTLSLPGILEEVLEDLGETYDVYQRIEMTQVLDEKVFADPVLVKMLLRNVIQNALQHTRMEIQIAIGHGVIAISDQGAGLNLVQQATLSGSRPAPGSHGVGGLGLFIVTLICERLSWQLAVRDRTGGGTQILLTYRKTDGVENRE
ncbi:MAG: HAMP domain-containing histidine kinase [Hahellaceae bacterium]|nr:HAMP domain-containing histidine kinase [Hahellaceae bacterium]MCP5168983.1 HAMP domain-containing histidine kinase [Hahellaceae bacterium]